MLWGCGCVCPFAGYEDLGQASAGSGDFCKGGYGNAVAAAAAAAAASAQNKPASSVTAPGVGECTRTPNALSLSPSLTLSHFLCSFVWSLALTSQGKLQSHGMPPQH